MKIQLLESVGKAPSGSTVEAVVAPNKATAIFYDDDSAYWYLTSSQFKEIGESRSQNLMTSIREMIGQDMARIEFK